MTQRLWVEGIYPSTNRALDLRGGEAVYLARSGGRAPRGESFSLWARTVRHAVAVQARASLDPVAEGWRAVIWIYLLEHCRMDADGWTIAGKWIVDGLADAGIVRSDRKDVYSVGGRAFGTKEEGKAFVGARDGLKWTGRPGALVELTAGAS